MRRTGGGRARSLVRAAGLASIAAGLVAMLVAVFQLSGTQAGSRQRAADDELEKAWADSTGGRPSPEHGEAFARLAIPRFGEDYRLVLREGVDEAALESGPGHYPGTAHAGEPGNFAVAGYRVGHGAAFQDLDELEACEPIIVETARDYFVYRVMPMAGEVEGWRESRRANPKCAKVPSLRTHDENGGPYRDTVGRKIVSADAAGAVAPVPYRTDNDMPKAHQAALLTLTTAHPEYGSDRQLVVHAVLTNQFGKTGDDDYRELLGRLGETA